MEDAARKSGDMEEPSLEALVQASLILVVAIAIIISNLLIIITYLNFRGKIQLSIRFEMFLVKPQRYYFYIFIHFIFAIETFLF